MSDFSPDPNRAATPFDGPNPTATSATGKAPIAISRLVATRDGGANWFFWVVGVSVVNTVLSLFSATLGSYQGDLALGLSGTSFIDAAISELIVTSQVPPTARGVGLGLDLLIFAFYAWCGVQARRGHSWAFALGGASLVLDCLLVLVFPNWLRLAFRVWALVMIFLGWQANQTLRSRAQTPSDAQL